MPRTVLRWGTRWHYLETKSPIVLRAQCHRSLIFCCYKDWFWLLFIHSLCFSIINSPSQSPVQGIDCAVCRQTCGTFRPGFMQHNELPLWLCDTAAAYCWPCRLQPAPACCARTGLVESRRLNYKSLLTFHCGCFILVLLLWWRPS